MTENDIQRRRHSIKCLVAVSIPIILLVISAFVEDTRADSPGQWDKAGISMHGDHTQLKIDYEFVHVYEYEGCEYLYLRDKNRAGLTHKGNCKNPIHVD